MPTLAPTRPIACFLCLTFIAINVVAETQTAVVKEAQKPKVLASESIFGEERVPKQEGSRLRLPRLEAPTTAIKAIGNGESPTDQASLAINETIPLPEGYDRVGNWMQSQVRWQASNTFSHPLYFEDAMLERHGQRCKHCCQSLVSGARFFTTLPLLPYVSTIERPCECYHTLGHYRPGSRAPCLIQRPPLQRDALLNEAAYLTGAFLIFP